MKLDDISPIAVVQEVRSGWSVGIRCLERVNASSFTDRAVRDFDTHPCDAFAAADADWGEPMDSLDNIPRKTQPTWIRALLTKGDD